MRNWEQLTALEQAAQIYSDVHKDAYGFRPRDGGIHNPKTLEEYNAAIERCSAVVDDEQEQERKVCLLRQQTWEEAITANLELGATDRETAIRWHIQSLGYEGSFHHCDVQEVESALYGTYPIRMWGILLREVWPTYTSCGVRFDLTPEQVESLTEVKFPLRTVAEMQAENA